MQRIINGHYADPESTRDIIGIPPTCFETIITAVQNLHQAMEAVMAGTPQQRREMIMFSIQQGMVNTEGMSMEDLEEKLNKSEEEMLKHYRNTYDILAAIKQPYPGADYKKIG